MARHSQTDRRRRIKSLAVTGHYRKPLESRSADLSGMGSGSVSSFRLRAMRGFSSPIAEFAASNVYTRRSQIEACREAYRLNPVMRRIINAEKENCVGVGFRTIPMTADPAWNRLAMEWLRHKYSDSEFSANRIPGHSEWGTHKLVSEHHHREGGIFVYRSSRGVQLFEDLQCQTPMDRMYDPRVRDGFQFAEDGTLEGFWIGPYTQDGRLNESDMTLVPAFYVDARFGVRLSVTSYIYASGFASGFRGSPPMAPSLDDLERFGDFYDAITERACQEANVVGVLKSNDPGASKSFNVRRNDSATNDTVDDVYDRPAYTEPGAVYRFKENEDFDIKGMTTPGNNFEPFTNQTMRLIACPASMPIEVAMMNFGKTNFSASKAAIEMYHIACRMTHKYYADSYSIPNYTMAIYEGMRDGDLPERDDWRRVAVIPPGWRGLDDSKDTKAAATRIECGLTTHTFEMAAAFGRGPEDNVRDIIDERLTIERLAREAGMDPDHVAAMFYGNPYGTATYNDVDEDEDSPDNSDQEGHQQ